MAQTVTCRAVQRGLLGYRGNIPNLAAHLRNRPRTAKPVSRARADQSVNSSLEPAQCVSSWKKVSKKIRWKIN